MPTVTSYPSTLELQSGTFIRPGGPTPPEKYGELRWHPQYGGSTSRVTASNPLWRIQIAKRQDAGVGYLRQTQELTPSMAECWTVGSGGYKGYSAESWYYGPGELPTNFAAFNTDSSVMELALQRLKRKLSKRVGGADALVPVAESRELRGLIRQASTMTTTLIRTLIDIKRTKGKSALKYASSAWLAYGFGISPLVDDTKKVCEAIADYLDKGDCDIRESASAKKEWLTHHGGTIYTGCYGAVRTHKVTIRHVLSYRWYCGGVTQVFSGNDYSLSKHLGFRKENLIPAFWELIPYSWVVDYFGTVGAYLEDTFWINPGVMHYSGYTRRYEAHGVINTNYTRWNSDWKVGFSSVPGVFTRREFQRVPLGGSLPHISLRWKMIDEVGNHGVTKLLNLASVLIQRKL